MNRLKVFRVMVGVTSFVALGLAAFPRSTNAQDNPTVGNYAPVNGLDLYYETYGEGEPLILLHGGLGGIGEFSQILPLLAETRQVIAVELQGHGHTADIDRSMSYETFADDIAVFIEYLGLENADIMGFSLGGGVALQTAIRHPEVVNKLIIVSSPFSRDGIHQEFQAGMSSEMMNAANAEGLIGTPMYAYYSSVAPDLEDWASLVDKLGQMLSADYDWSEQVAGITAPTLIIAGDSDQLYPAHAAEMFGLLGGGVAGDFVGLPASQLAILPGTSHFSILYRPDLLMPVINPFLNPPPATQQ